MSWNPLSYLGFSKNKDKTSPRPSPDSRRIDYADQISEIDTPISKALATGGLTFQNPLPSPVSSPEIILQLESIEQSNHNKLFGRLRRKRDREFHSSPPKRNPKRKCIDPKSQIPTSDMKIKEERSLNEFPYHKKEDEDNKKPGFWRKYFCCF